MINKLEFNLDNVRTLSLFYFYANWCQPSIDMLNILAELEIRYSHIKFYKVNVQDVISIPNSYGIELPLAIPYIYILNPDTKKISQIAGSLTEEEIIKSLNIYA